MPDAPVAWVRAHRVALIRAGGALCSLCYAAFVLWLQAAQPRTLAEVRGGLTASVGAYAIDRRSFEEGLAYFRSDRFAEARSAFDRADPAKRDPITQFYVAYSYLREGWGRLGSDDGLYRQGLAALERAVSVAPGGIIRVDDQNLTLRTSDELRAELERGLRRDWSDLNPTRIFRSRP